MSGQHVGPLCAGVLLLALPLGCTSYETALAEFDSVSNLATREAEPQQAQYLDNPIHLFDTVGAAADEENANQFARERIQILVDKAWGDRQHSTEVIWRLLWVAELDRSPLNRILALQGMSQLMEGLGLAMIVEDLRDPLLAADSEVLLDTLSERWSQANRGELDDAGYRELIDIMDLCNQVTLRTPLQRRRLVQELAPDRYTGSDPELQQTRRETLDRALEHAVYTMFIIHLLDNLPSGVEVRRAAIREIRRRAGPDSVALILRITRRPREMVQPGQLGFDPSPDVILELIRLCGQLDRERALRGNGTGPAPAEFLYEVIRAPAAPRGVVGGLRFLAMEALALSLGVPMSFDPQWADDWFRSWNEERIRRGPGR